ncbi:MAG: enamine deaminase RidA [SAR86 cluster bacterium]|uniref:Enamine deaminase RidA n=1 Tax=SAR86 cluster bacterium TaxID=2030880 RepID=A0A2A5CIP8_9GAMM|nr:MAG: enamine deaminase RidA [SAR86 cluster bacterium]
MEFINPDDVVSPQGLYSHIVKVPSGTELLFISGQLGIKPDGSTPNTIEGQSDQVFSNIVTILKSQGLGVENIVKLTTFIVAGQDGQAVRNARIKYLGAHRPASTAVYISQLVDPAWFVEVEAVVSTDVS